MLKQLIAVSVVALCVGVGTTAAQSGTQFPQQIGDTFIFHAELVSFDGGSKTLTFKAQVLTEAEKDLGRFKAGERVLLTWSGADKYASGIRAVANRSGDQKVGEPFALGAELVSPAVQGGLVTLRLRAAGAKTESVASVKPGEWVTVTARQRPASDAQAVTLVERYVKPI